MKRRTANGFGTFSSPCVLALCLLAFSVCSANASSPAEKNSLSFELFDSYGRKVCSTDYGGVPVFLEFGACW